MVNVAMSKKRLLAFIVAACVGALLIAMPAYAMFYVHGNDYGVGQDENGAYPVTVTVDGSAVGQPVWTTPAMIPANAPTVQAALEQAINSSESQNGVDAIHNYGYTSVDDLIAGRNATVKVYKASDQKPGTQTTQDSAGEEVSNPSSTTLDRYDQVVVTLG